MTVEAIDEDSAVPPSNVAKENIINPLFEVVECDLKSLEKVVYDAPDLLAIKQAEARRQALRSFHNGR